VDIERLHRGAEPRVQVRYETATVNIVHSSPRATFADR